MKRRLPTVLLFLFWVTCPAMSRNGTPVPDYADDLHVLENWIEAQRSFRDIPGMAVGIVRDQELVYARGLGVEDLETGEAVTPETGFRMASVTKTFTATAIMQLRDAGKLQLDDPIAKYLTWFQIQDRFPEYPEITVWNLLTHTSGLPREAAFPYWTDHEFPSIQEIIAKLPQQETIYPPGTHYKYSNLGITLAGEIVETVSGESYPEYIQHHILEPLGMTHSSIKPDQDLRENLITPYSQRMPGDTHIAWDYYDTQGITAAANLVSTVEDMARFLAMQFRDEVNEAGQILRGSSLQEMHRVQFLKENWSGARGLGFSVWRLGKYTVDGHGGWVAGNRTQIAFVPSAKVGVVVMTNTDDGIPGFFTDEILKFVLPLLEVTETRVEQPPIAQLRKYTGNYRDPWWYDMEIVILDGGLAMIEEGFPPEGDPHSGVTCLFPEGEENLFRMSGPNGNGETVRFVLDSENRVTRVWVGDNYYGRLEDYPLPSVGR